MRFTASRRRFLAILATAIAPCSADAQKSPRVYRIGYVSAFGRKHADAFLTELRSELRKLGWTEGSNLLILEPRLADGRSERLPQLAKEVIDLQPDLILVHSAPATRALMQATATIPIVMISVGDPVTYGLIEGFARPGANVTGSSFLIAEAESKLLGLLKEIAPRVTSVAVFINPTNEGAVPYLRTAQEAAPSLGLQVHGVEVRSAEDFDRAFARVAEARAEAVLVAPEALIVSQRPRIAEFAARLRIPVAVHGTLLSLDGSELIAYGAAGADYGAITARYVDRILKGARPADLPVEQPTKFKLVINMRAAKTLGLAVPPSLLVRADEVIQ